MSMLRLICPTAELQEQYVDFYKDWINSGEDIVPWVVEKDPSDFKAFLDFLYAENSEEKLSDPTRVPHSTYWLLNEDELLVGAVNIRHRLNDYLLSRGGHIGYGVRPAFRRKGYATVILSQALQIVKHMGLEQVLVTCDKTNIGSAKTIQKNGGILESEFTEEDGNVVMRFWIKL